MTGQSVKRGPDRSAFVCIPVWLLTSGISPKALKLYADFASVLKGQTGHVPQAVMAGWLGLTRVGTVKRYADELVDVGALEVTKVSSEDGMRHRNTYRLIGPPAPEGAGGRHG